MMMTAMKISWKALKLMNCTFNSVLKKSLLKDSAKTSLEPNSIQTMLDLDLGLRLQTSRLVQIILQRKWFKQLALCTALENSET